MNFVSIQPLVLYENVYSSEITRRTRSRSGRDVAPLSSKRPRYTTENTKYFLIVVSVKSLYGPTL